MNIFFQSLADIFRLKIDNLLGWGSAAGLLIINQIPAILAVIAPLAMLAVSIYIKVDSHRREQRRKEEGHKLDLKIKEAEHMDALTEFNNHQNHQDHESTD